MKIDDFESQSTKYRLEINKLNRNLNNAILDLNVMKNGKTELLKN